MNNRIVNIREENELTQQELANIIGGSRVNISNWENKKELPNIQRINKIADHFNVSLDYLFFLNNNKNYQGNKPGKINKNLAGQRLRAFRKSNNLTLRRLADELHTTSSTISAYETGKTLILTAFALQLCKNHNLSMDWLYGKKDD